MEKTSIIVIDNLSLKEIEISSYNEIRHSILIFGYSLYDYQQIAFEVKFDNVFFEIKDSKYEYVNGDEFLNMISKINKIIKFTQNYISKNKIIKRPELLVKYYEFLENEKLYFNLLEYTLTAKEKIKKIKKFLFKNCENNSEEWLINSKKLKNFLYDEEIITPLGNSNTSFILTKKR